MSEKTKRDKINAGKECENEEEISPNEDSERHSYYDDDAHGYEIYQPEDDEEDEELSS